jgi:hypothetical protein
MPATPATVTQADRPDNAISVSDRPIYAAVSVLALALLLLPTLDWPLDDFAEYWAAGRLNLAGGNPYDPSAMLAEQRQIGWTATEPVMMYNPPWTLALAMAFGAVPFYIARSLWLPVQILVTLWCAVRLWALYGGAPHHAIRAGGVALLWMPTLAALRMGQLSPLILLGLVGFLWSLAHRREFGAGMFMALTFVKPQLVALVCFAFLVWAVADRRWHALAGALVGTGLASITAVALNPDVFGEYGRLMSSTPPTHAFESPNIATILRAAVGRSSDWLQYLPVVLGALIVAFRWHRRRNSWDWSDELPTLIVLSCLVTPYGGWGFDLVVLLLPILAIAARLQRANASAALWLAGGVFSLITCIACILHAARAPQATFIWMVPVVALSVFVVKRLATDQPIGSSFEA